MVLFHHVYLYVDISWFLLKNTYHIYRNGILLILDLLDCDFQTFRKPHLNIHVLIW